MNCVSVVNSFADIHVSSYVNSYVNCVNYVNNYFVESKFNV